MTREEAIEALTSKDVNNSDIMLEALDMAVKALEQEPCDDSISRQAILSMQYRIDDSATLSTRDVVNVDDIEDLPPVIPKPKTGHWIPMGLVDANDNKNYECSECHHGDTHAKNQIVPYCWYCGAKMESEE